MVPFLTREPAGLSGSATEPEAESRVRLTGLASLPLTMLSPGGVRAASVNADGVKLAFGLRSSKIFLVDVESMETNARRYRNPFGHILVDEFQDISPSRTLRTHRPRIHVRVCRSHLTGRHRRLRRAFQHTSARQSVRPGKESIFYGCSNWPCRVHTGRHVRRAEPACQSDRAATSGVRMPFAVRASCCPQGRRRLTLPP